MSEVNMGSPTSILNILGYHLQFIQSVWFTHFVLKLMAIYKLPLPPRWGPYLGFQSWEGRRRTDPKPHIRPTLPPLLVRMLCDWPNMSELNLVGSFIYLGHSGISSTIHSVGIDYASSVNNDTAVDIETLNQININISLNIEMIRKG